MTRSPNLCAVTWFAVIAPLFVSLHAADLKETARLQTALDVQAGVVERTRAFTDLREIATGKSITALAPLLHDPEWGYAARSVLEVMPGPEADRALLAALRSADRPELAAGLVNSLGVRRSAEAIPAIAKLTTSSEPMLADAALNALGNIGNPRAAEVLAGIQPSEALRATWADAMLRVAEALRSSDRQRSLSLYRSVIAIGPSDQLAAASMGLARGSEQPIPMVVAALGSADIASRRAALSLIRAGEFGPDLTSAVARSFGALRADARVQVLSVLQDRGDRAAAPLAREALAATEADVRAAAARLLSVVGDASDAPALLRIMTGPEEPAPSARLALARLPGDETTIRLLECHRRKGADRPAALEVLVSRGYRALLPELLRGEIFADAAFGRLAANAIGTLGTATDLERVLSVYGELSAGDRAVLAPAVRRIAAKHSSPDEAASRVIQAMGQLPPAEHGPLATVLAGVGGDRAFAFVSGMLESTSADTRRLALRTFGSWGDSGPIARLLDIARRDPDPAVRSVAVQSATAVLRKNAVDTDGPPASTRMSAAIEGLRQTWEVAEQPEARNAIVVALRGLKAPKALAAAEELEKKGPRGK